MPARAKKRITHMKQERKCLKQSDYLKDYCELVFLDRTPGVSTTQIKKDLGLQEAIVGVDQLPGEPEE